jgi:hypothetical protein
MKERRIVTDYLDEERIRPVDLDRRMPRPFSRPVMVIDI